MRDIDLLPQVLKNRSLSPREIVLTYQDALQALDILVAVGWACLGWEGWLNYPDGKHGFAPIPPGPDVERGRDEDWGLFVARSARLCKESIAHAQHSWEQSSPVPGAQLYFCITATNWIECGQARYQITNSVWARGRIARIIGPN